MAKKKESSDPVECLDCNEVEEEGFVDGEVDWSKHKLVTSFSFGGSVAAGSDGNGNGNENGNENIVSGSSTSSGLSNEFTKDGCDAPLVAAGSQSPAHPLQNQTQLHTNTPPAPVNLSIPAVPPNPAPPKGMLFQSKESPKASLMDNRTLHTNPFGKTPPVDGENFEVSRTFMFRRSTVRMLNRIKAEHPDENIYLSSIVDEALRYYYRHVVESSK